MPKTAAPVKIQNNASIADFVDGHTSPKIVICPTGSAPYDAKATVLSASNTTCTGTICLKHVHTRDIIQ